MALSAGLQLSAVIADPAAATLGRPVRQSVSVVVFPFVIVAGNGPEAKKPGLVMLTV
jgi:hypothetical protein